jgi:S1-C subfamily serine protease
MLEARLRQVLAGMAALFDDPTIGPLLLRALLIASPEGIRAIGDSVVLTDWGLAPVGNSLPAEPLAALAASPLGPFLPAPAPHAAPAAAPGAAAPRPAAAAAAAAPIAFAPAAPTTKSPWNWWLLPIVLVIAAFCLALGVWRGQQIVAAALLGRPNTVQLFDEAAARRALAQQNEENAALEHEIEERRHALAGNVCQMDPAQVPRLGADRRAAPPAGAVPQLPGAPPFQGNLADLLKQALVLVVVPQTGDSVVLGSGFFVTADMIATNRHVVEKAIDGKILVTSRRSSWWPRATIPTSARSMWRCFA